MTVSGTGDEQAAAKVREGTLLEQQGELAAAEIAYRQADELGSGEGASNLGALLFERDALDEAEDALRRADQRGDAMGTFRLGFLLQMRGDYSGAGQAYRRAVGRGSYLAANNLGLLLDDQGDREAGRPFLELATRSPDPRLARSARSAMVERGMVPRPRPVPPPEYDPERSLMDSLLWIGGDPADARVRRAREIVFRDQMETITPDEAPAQATMWDSFGEPDKATSLLRLAAERGGHLAAFRLGTTFAERGDTDRARILFAMAAEAPDKVLAVAALQRLQALAS